MLIPEHIVRECKSKLLQNKQDLLNRARDQRMALRDLDTRSGDEADQTMSLLAENEFLNAQQRIEDQLYESEQALARIERGAFGICEETEEPIEIERLRALPWTRLSIEGAEIRESTKKRFAR